MDCLYEQRIPFHHTISKNYKSRTIEALRGKKKPNNNDVSRVEIGHKCASC